MSSRHLVDPELLPGLDAFPPLTLDADNLLAVREAFGQATVSPLDFADDRVAISRIAVPGPAGAPEVPAWLFRPLGVAAPVPAYLDIHGGGYVLGTAAMDAPANARIAAELGVLVVSPDYRLAPETEAPGAVEDCHAVLSWLDAHADALGVDRTRIAIGGQSAGGGLAAALTLMARDRGRVAPCFQLLVYPMLDDRTALAETGSGNRYTGEFVWNRASNRFGWSALRGAKLGHDDPAGTSVPARAAVLAGLPPAYICTGALDLFLEEDCAYAQALIAAGVACELHVFAGAYHGFEIVTEAQVTRIALAERIAVLARALGLVRPG